jgi:hypothetical protein
MKCNWDIEPKSGMHIPKICGRDAVVIYQGPRDFQVYGFCKEHLKTQQCQSCVKNDWLYEEFTPEDYIVYRVMSE